MESAKSLRSYYKKQLPIILGAEIVLIKTELDTAEYNIL